MGAELSKGLYESECIAPGRSASEFSDEEFDGVDALTLNTHENSEDDFFSPISAAGDGAEVLAGKTIILFDWDDTLLCSSAISMSHWTLKQLRELEKSVESILHTAMGLGETLIVTNGNSTWVQDSAKRFMPRLLPVIEKLRVVSARALYEHRYPADPFMWKRAAFRQLLLEERVVSPETGLNLIALGDQMPEIEAAHLIAKDLGLPSRAKTVKFKESPSVPELIGQLSRAERELGRLVTEPRGGKCGLVRRQLPAHLDHAVSQAVAWRLSAQDESTAWPVARSLSLKELWPFFS